MTDEKKVQLANLKIQAILLETGTQIYWDETNEEIRICDLRGNESVELLNPRQH